MRVGLGRKKFVNILVVAEGRLYCSFRWETLMNLLPKEL